MRSTKLYKLLYIDLASTCLRVRHKPCLVADTALITTRATSTAGGDTRPLSDRADCNHAWLHAFAGYSKGISSRVYYVPVLVNLPVHASSGLCPCTH
ncbi:hypothetical protein KCU95_g19, partial [Aureobasidium melanogenum]